MENKLIVKLPKNILYKSARYLVRIRGYKEQMVTYANNKAVFELPTGNYMVEVENEEEIAVKRIMLTVGQRKVMCILPAIRNTIIYTLVVALGATSITVQAAVLKQFSVPLLLLPLLPLLAIRRRKVNRFKIGM